MADEVRDGPSVPPESYFSIFEFMSSPDGLALKGVELNVYALIYSYSQGKGGCYYGSNAYTAHRAGCSERHAIEVVHSLEARGLVANVGQRKLGGRCTNMYVAVQAKVDEAIAGCNAAQARGNGASAPKAAAGPGETIPPPAKNIPEASSCRQVQTTETTSGVNQPPYEASSGASLKPAHPLPEPSSPYMKAIGNVYESGVGVESAGATPAEAAAQPPADFDKCFRDLVRAYPYAKDSAEARELYAPLYAKGVRAEHVMAILGDWERAHPARDGQRPYTPDLEKFLDANSSDGYAALAKAAKHRSQAKRRKALRELTAKDSAAEIYERYTVDGLDATATTLYRRHLDEGGVIRREPWDRWYQYMSRHLDSEARAHWLELKQASRP